MVMTIPIFIFGSVGASVAGFGRSFTLNGLAGFLYFLF
jgi:hypothetical protein